MREPDFRTRMKALSAALAIPRTRIAWCLSTSWSTYQRWERTNAPLLQAAQREMLQHLEALAKEPARAERFRRALEARGIVPALIAAGMP